MVLGDSLTWGEGLAVEERYTYLLERLLQQTVSRLRVEVLNFGLSGYPTVRERDILLEHIDAVDPDRIVIGFCINDPQPKGQNYATELERFRLPFDVIRTLGLLGLKHTSGFLRDRFDQTLRNAGLVPQPLDALDRTYAKESDEWIAFEEALRDINTLSDARGLPAPIFAPLLQGTGDFGQPSDHLTKVRDWCRQAAEAARRHGFQVVDMETDFIAEGYRDRRVRPWDGHPDAKCNEIYARHIAEAARGALLGAESAAAIETSVETVAP